MSGIINHPENPTDLEFLRDLPENLSEFCDDLDLLIQAHDLSSIKKAEDRRIAEIVSAVKQVLNMPRQPDNPEATRIILDAVNKTIELCDYFSAAVLYLCLAIQKKALLAAEIQNSTKAGF